METDLKFIPAEVLPLNGSDYLRNVGGLLDKANATIDIMMYQWRWHPYEGASDFQQFSIKFCAAARRHVKVRALLNSEQAGNNLTMMNAKTAETLRNAGCEAKLAPPYPTIHSKLLIIDDEFVVVGSHNYSKKSHMVNNESSVLIRSKEVARLYKNYFDLRWKAY